MIPTTRCRMTVSSNRLPVLVPLDSCITMNKLSYFLLLLLVLISVIITESHLFSSLGVKAKIPKLSPTSLHNKFRRNELLNTEQNERRTPISHQYNEKLITSSYTRSQGQLSNTFSVSGIESANVDNTRNDTLLTRKETESFVEDEPKLNHEMFSNNTSNPMRFAITSTVLPVVPQVNEIVTTAPTPIPIINSNLRFNSYLLSLIAKAVQPDGKKSIFCFFAAGLTGFTDVLYKLRYGCFVNMMTGNTISFIKNCMDGGTGYIINASFYISLIVAYIAGSMATVRICKPTVQEERTASSTTVTTKRRNAFPKCIKIIPSVLSLFVIADIIGSYATPAYRRFGATALSFAYGLLNVVCIEVTGGTILYAVTGHMNRIAKAVNEVFAMINIERKNSYNKRIQQQRQQQYPYSTTTSSTTPFDEVKFMDHIYLISFHSRVFIGFVVGVIAGYHVLSRMPVMVGGGGGRQALDVLVTSTTQQSRNLLSNCIRNFVPMNTIIGSLYVLLLFWYGRYGAERPALDTNKQSQ